MRIPSEIAKAISRFIFNRLIRPEQCILFPEREVGGGLKGRIRRAIETQGIRRKQGRVQHHANIVSRGIRNTKTVGLDLSRAIMFQGLFQNVACPRAWIKVRYSLSCEVLLSGVSWCIDALEHVLDIVEVDMKLGEVFCEAAERLDEGVEIFPRRGGVEGVAVAGV